MILGINRIIDYILVVDVRGEIGLVRKSDSLHFAKETMNVNNNLKVYVRAVQWDS
jgi:hypothetical protein